MKISEVDKKIIGIYKINFPNGKNYIGLSNNIKRRIIEHFNDNRQLVLYNAIKKYYSCINDIDFDILEEIQDENYMILSQKERYWISYFSTNTKEKGYNLTDGGIDLLSIKNPFAKFNEEEIEQIYSLLEQGYSNVKISSIFKCHPDTISKINVGKTYYNSFLTYPIRKETFLATGFDNHGSITKNQYKQVVDYLINSDLNFSEIAKTVNIAVSTCHRINQGKTHFDNSFSYPLRKSSKHKVTKIETKEIVELLKQGEFSITYISQLYGCSRDTISDINNGKRHKIEGEVYPIRTKYPSRRLSKITKKPVSTILESEEQGDY